MKNRVRFAPRHRAALLAVGVALVPGVFAQTVSSSSSSSSAGSEPQLRPVVVTATRVESRADEVLADLVVIERSAIESSAARTLPELLARDAGLQTTANGGPGQAASLFTRGTSGRHTLLLVDGVRVNSLYTATAPWETIPVETIERIEVLKGPASALYGADAAGGVVQVFTRQGREGRQTEVALTAGTLGHGRVAASVQGGDKEGLRYALGMQQMAEKGISATSPNAGASSYVADRDGFRQGSLNGSLRMPINKDWRLDASMLHSNGVSRFDEYNGTGTDSRTVVRAAVLQAGFTGQVSRDWLTQVSIGQSEDTHNPIRSIYYTPVRSTLSNLTWQNTLATRAGAVLAGAEFSRQEIEQSPPPAQPRRDTRSVFAGLNGQSGMQLWQANLRRDSSNAYGDRNTGLLSYGLQFTPEWRASASWGQTFVAPSFGDLYDAYNGNPNLRPEHGVNRELSLGWTQEQRQAKLTWFDNRIRDLLAYDSVSDKVQNLSAARLRGWTLSGKVRVAGANLRASLDGLDPRAEDTGKLLVRRARQQASLGADWQQGAWRWGASLLHVGERYDDAANTAAKRLPAYSTVDLFAQWRFARDFDLQMKVNNATDRHYETVYGYNQPGRTAYLTLRWQTR